ncbi:hypothetical protein C0J52_26789 [Blattella germanica]|nr:hypothetical protein C0J52_26789 [Blattella germanica]
MPVIGHVTMPSDPEKRKALFGFNERPQIGKLLADFMLDMLILPYSVAVQQEQTNTTNSIPVPAGMSEYSLKRVTAGSVFKSEDLEQIKLGIVKLIGSEILEINCIICHLIVASADTRFTVADTAEMELKKYRVQHLTHQHAMIITAACAAISEVGRCAPLPFPDASSDSWKLDLVKTLLEIMNNAKLSTKIDLYHKEILTDLITNLTAREWRVRMSCCLALVDFLQGGGSRTLYDCVDSLPELWTQIFRVMDDVHEGTRQAAGNTAKVLSKLTEQCSDVSRGKAGEEMVRKVLPVLLNVGICNTVFEVRAVRNSKTHEVEERSIKYSVFTC